MTLYSYAWALNWNVALVSLTNVETYFQPYVGAKTLTVSSQGIDRFPTREIALSGRQRGDGLKQVQWSIRAMPRPAWNAIFDDFYGNGSTVSPKMTINTRDLDDGDVYTRWNVYAYLPAKGGEYRFERNFVLDVTINFALIEAL